MRRFVLVLVALLLPVFALGCGGGEEETTAPEAVEGETPTQTEGGGEAAEGDPEAGKEVFASAGCGNCHTFEPAGSNATVGPNLDDAQLSFEQVVQQVTNGGGAMPAFKGKLSEKQIADVAAFVTSGR